MASNENIPTNEVEKFILFVDAVKEDESGDGFAARQQWAQLKCWASSLDDELLAIVLNLCSWGKGARGVTLSALQDVALPLGMGRSVVGLINALLSAGVLAPSTEQ